MTVRVAAFALCSLLAAAHLPAPAQAFAPTSDYKERTIQGFTVLVNKSLSEHQREAAEAIKELESQLKKIARVVPAGPLADLRKVRIWLEWNDKPEGAAEFHPSAEWLTEHGYNPEKAGGMEIANARNFVGWSRGEQPWMVLHELAHAFHFRVLGEGYEANEDAYRQAMDRKIYDSVDYIKGSKQRAYATTNAKEYFAELSEAYFGKNDFFPFNRDDLERHDPAGFRLMEQAWGRPRGEGAREE